MALAALAACGDNGDAPSEDVSAAATAATNGEADEGAAEAVSSETEPAEPASAPEEAAGADASPPTPPAVAIAEEDELADLSDIEGDEPLVSFSIPGSRLISETGLGPYTWDMTVGAFKAATPDAEFVFEPYYMVDFSALCAHEGGVERVCAVFFETDAPSDDERIEFLATEDPDFRTAEGVGPGVSIADAKLIYGDAFFSYNTSNESREYVEFDRGPAENVGFRASSTSSPDGFAGIYDVEAEFNETEEHHADAVISRVEVLTPRGR